MIESLSFDNINDILGKKALIEFYSSDCAYCRMIDPLIEKAAAEKPEFSFYRVNVDDERELAESFRIKSVPTLISIKDSEITDKKIGVLGKSELYAMMGE